MRAIKKFKKLMFTIHEIVWWTVSELEDWLYPYKDRLTPEDRFEVRVKDPLSGDMYMVEELIQQMNQKVDKLQDDMMYVRDKLAEHEEKLSFKVKKRSQSPSVSGKVKV